MFIQSMVNAGAGESTTPEAAKIRTANIVALLTCFIAFLYALFFVVMLEQPFLAAVNILFVVCYVAPVLLARLDFSFLAKIWFFSVLMAHVFLLTTFVFTPNTGFHFYYLLVPPGVFLIFNHVDQGAKLTLTAIALMLFFVCDASNHKPMLQIDQSTEQIIFTSTIVVIMVEIYLIMSYFSQSINKHQQELTALANVDVLTGLNNRRTMLQFAEEMISLAKRYRHHFSLIIFDIDHFKQINDIHGHQMGDAALIQVATLLKKHVRASDVVARYGGEEFVVLLPETQLAGAKQLAESLRKCIEDTLISLEEDNVIKCTISGGVAELELDGENLEKLISRADSALYQAKAQGRNQIGIAH